jgi:hypothetical protein
MSKGFQSPAATQSATKATVSMSRPTSSAFARNDATAALCPPTFVEETSDVMRSALISHTSHSQVARWGGSDAGSRASAARSASRRCETTSSTSAGETSTSLRAASSTSVHVTASRSCANALATDRAIATSVVKRRCAHAVVPTTRPRGATEGDSQGRPQLFVEAVVRWPQHARVDPFGVRRTGAPRTQRARGSSALGADLKAAVGAQAWCRTRQLHASVRAYRRKRACVSRRRSHAISTSSSHHRDHRMVHQ